MAGIEGLLGGLAGGQGGTPDLGALLGQLTGGQSGGTGGGAPDLGSLSALAGPLLPQLQGGGGLEGLLGNLTSSGLGDQVQSWIGTGATQAVDPSALANAVGAAQVQQLASQAGVSVEQAQQGLSQLLPGIVDSLSPSGQLPAGDQMSAVLGQLGDALRGR